MRTATLSLAVAAASCALDARAFAPLHRTATPPLLRPPITDHTVARPLNNRATRPPPLWDMFAGLESIEPGSLEQRLQEVFDLVDTDASGHLDREELAALLDKLDLEATPDEVEALFMELDHDGSGHVDFDEFLAWYEDAADAAIDRRSDLLQVISGRRCAPAFEEIVVPSRVIDDAISAALYAPDHRKSEPWRFRVLGPETVAKVSDSMGLAKPTAPCCVVVTCALDQSNVEEEADDFTSCCCAVQNFMLALHVEGLGTRWVSPGSVELNKSAARVKFDEAVGLDPSNERLVAVVWLGFVAGGLERIPVTKRMSVDDVRLTLP